MTGRAPRPRFPLADWIDEHPELKHQISSSGMGGQLRSTRAALARREPASEEELVRLFSDALGVAPGRLFLTHGATEANALVLFHLARDLRRRAARTPRVRIDRPEYPPLFDGAEFAGFGGPGPDGRCDLVVRSDPNNPTGLAAPGRGTPDPAADATAVLVDETFREFTPRPSAARADREGRWVTGTLTKVYGADEVRVGYAVAPSGAVPAFERTCGLIADRIGAVSRAQAAAILRDRPRILREVRGIFDRNLRALRRALPGAPRLIGPVWFDRPGGPHGGDRLAEFAARNQVLVAPGRYFGDPSGLRACLTRRSFPEDLDAYLALRARWIARNATARGTRGG